MAGTHVPCAAGLVAAAALVSLLHGSAPVQNSEKGRGVERIVGVDGMAFSLISTKPAHEVLGELHPSIHLGTGPVDILGVCVHVCPVAGLELLYVLCKADALWLRRHHHTKCLGHVDANSRTRFAHGQARLQPPVLSLQRLQVVPEALTQ